MVTYFYRDASGYLSRPDNFQPGCWIHVESPSQEELRLLADRFGLDRDLLADALDPDEIPRLEKEDGQVYIFMRRASRREEPFQTAPVLLVLAQHFVVSVSATAVPELSSPTDVTDFITVDQPRLILALASTLLKTYERGVSYLTRSIRTARSGLTAANVSNSDFVRFVLIEDSLNELLSDLVPFGSMFNSLLVGKNPIAINEDDRDHAEDLLQAPSS